MPPPASTHKFRHENMKSSIASFIFFFLTSFGLQADSAIFDYEDFGPQVAVHELIGYQWYQWNSHGHSNPDTIDKIMVVVYWDESLENIKKRYPIIPAKKQDYRYMEYSLAVSHLIRLIPELKKAGAKTNFLESTLQRLTEIKEANKEK